MPKMLWQKIWSCVLQVGCNPHTLSYGCGRARRSCTKHVTCKRLFKFDASVLCLVSQSSKALRTSPNTPNYLILGNVKILITLVMRIFYIKASVGYADDVYSGQTPVGTSVVFFFFFPHYTSVVYSSEDKISC
jgi:hypothetical protein